MEILTTIILFGAIQGFICSAILIFSKTKKNPLADKLLAILIILLSLACLNIYLMLSGLPDRYSFVQTLGFFLPLTIAMPIGPLIYYYHRSIFEQNVVINKIHFLPVVLDLIPYGFGLLYVLEGSRSLIDAMDLAHTYVDIPRWISTTIYLTITARTWFTKPNRANTPKFFGAFVAIFIVFQAVWLLHLIPYIVPATRETLMNIAGWYPLYIPLAALVYWLGFYGITLQKETIPNRANLDEKKILEVLSKLKASIETGRLFLNPDLNLTDVVNETGIQQKQISAVLNQHLSLSFNEYVNQLRVAEMQKRLSETGHDHLTLSGLALECGFNSNATFQRAFKHATGMTPRQYKESLKSGNNTPVSSLSSEKV